MLAKLATLLQSKVALAVIGAALIGGGGTAAAVVVNHNSQPSHVTANGAGNQAGDTAEATKNADNEGHHVSIEGVLKSYNANGNTITVTVTHEAEDDQADAKATGTPGAGEHESGTPSASTHESSTPGAGEHESSTPEATKSATPVDMTITVNGDTRVNGEKATKLSDLASGAGHKVEVQATKQSNGSLLATKVTLQGADTSGDDHSGTTSGGSGESTSGSGDHSGQGTQREVDGAVSSVGSGSFVVTADGHNVTVDVNSKTIFAGTIHSLSDLKQGVKVRIQGTVQADGSVLAISVSAEASN